MDNAQSSTGGFLSIPKVSYSQETHKRLQELLQESRISARLRNTINKAVRDGQPLPGASSDQKKSTQNTDTNQSSHQCSSTGLRTRQQILKSGAYKRDTYMPAATRKNLDEEKRRLQNQMAYGADEEPINIRPEIRSEPIPEVNRFYELQEEVADRYEFLARMEELGHGHKYRTKILNEVSEKIREMEKLNSQQNTSRTGTSSQTRKQPSIVKAPWYCADDNEADENKTDM